MSGPRKSFQTYMKWNSATTANAGRDSGMMMSFQMRNSEQPSTRAESDNSKGIDMKNWRSKKMLNAAPNQAGTHNGLGLPTHPSLRKITYTGTISTGNGIIIVASVAAKMRSLPGHLIRAKP